MGYRSNLANASARQSFRDTPSASADKFYDRCLETPDLHHLQAAHGYIELGMFEEANAVLEEIDPLCRHLPEVLQARVAIYLSLEKWELAAIVGQKLVQWDSDEPGHYIDWAYAVRRSE